MIVTALLGMLTVPFMITIGLLLLAYSKNKSVKNGLYYIAAFCSAGIILSFLSKVAKLLLVAVWQLFAA